MSFFLHSQQYKPHADNAVFSTKYELKRRHNVDDVLSYEN